MRVWSGLFTRRGSIVNTPRGNTWDFLQNSWLLFAHEKAALVGGLQMFSENRLFLYGLYGGQSSGFVVRNSMGTSPFSWKVTPTRMRLAFFASAMNRLLFKMKTVVLL